MDTADQKQRNKCDRIPEGADTVLLEGVENIHLTKYQQRCALRAAELYWPLALDCVPAMARIATRV